MDKKNICINCIKCESKIIHCPECGEGRTEKQFFKYFFKFDDLNDGCCRCIYEKIVEGGVIIDEVYDKLIIIDNKTEEINNEIIKISENLEELNNETLYTSNSNFDKINSLCEEIENDINKYLNI